MLTVFATRVSTFVDLDDVREDGEPKNGKVRAQLGKKILFTSNKEEVRLVIAVFSAERNKYRDKRYQ